ncbi:MAG: tRNA (N(6)-L-threonylcarbamoyladenosine(37)-C(2))-methylthiotransferase MtaB, partial [Clostridia bacterium]|nr:tRNA (N(6)-L-threonylcarbamoyladenosine(37)-C(2))-methylthiotransferase MtaB [Clostridia bacterium]
MKKRVALLTLGCKVNQYESTAILEMLKAAGWQEVDFHEEADAYLVNTCTVTHIGDRKSRQMLRRAARRNPQAIIAALGCYAQVAPEELAALPEIDLVLGNGDKNRLPEILAGLVKGKKEIIVHPRSELQEFEEFPAVASTCRTRAFLKIQEGCNNFCSYCIIPYARGSLRSRDPQRALAESRQLVAEGFKEIVLTGIHTGAYGQEKPGSWHLADLLRQMRTIPGLKRLRLSSLEPMDCNAEIIELLAEGQPFCPHLHIPLQSGSDAVLRQMHRHYNCREFAQLVANIRQKIANAALTTDVIVGFPGETEEQFAESCQFIRQMGFAALHVFKYSPRQGTLAAGFPHQVPEETKEERSRRLLKLAAELRQNYAQDFVGQSLSVLVEEEAKPGWWQGFTPNYLKVIFPGSSADQGKILSIKIRDWQEGF